MDNFDPDIYQDLPFLGSLGSFGSTLKPSSSSLANALGMDPPANQVQPARTSHSHVVRLVAFVILAVVNEVPQQQPARAMELYPVCLLCLYIYCRY